MTLVKKTIKFAVPSGKLSELILANCRAYANGRGVALNKIGEEDGVCMVSVEGPTEVRCNRAIDYLKDHHSVTVTVEDVRSPPAS